MTFRQREFCRHYLKGLPALQAAVAAGYARSTAERNATDILSADSVQRYLHRHRQEALFVTPSLMRCNVERLARLVDHEDERIALSAFRELRQIAKCQSSLFLDLSEELASGKAEKNPMQSIENECPDFEKIKSLPESASPVAPIRETDTQDRYDFSDLSAHDLIRVVGCLNQERHALEIAAFKADAPSFEIEEQAPDDATPVFLNRQQRRAFERDQKKQERQKARAM